MVKTDARSEIRRAAGEERTGDAPPAGWRRSRAPVIGIVVVVLLGSLAWGVRRWDYARSHASTDNAHVEGHIVPVLAKVGGYVAEVRVEDDQRVAKGEVLVLLDEMEYRERLAQAEAELAAAEAVAGVAGQAEAQVAEAAGRHEALRAQITAARAQAERAESDLGRIEELAAKQIVSRQQLDAARAAAAAAGAQVNSFERQASGAGAGVSAARAGVRVAKARLDAARAARDNAALQLSYARILAPVAGRVARKQAEPGQLVQPGQPLLSVIADTTLWITANFKETQLADIRIGQPVEVDIDAYPDCTAAARVESISGATVSKFALLPPDNATGNYTKVVQRIPVRLRVIEGCGSERPLRPGMSIVAHVATN